MSGGIMAPDPRHAERSGVSPIDSRDSPSHAQVRPRPTTIQAARPSLSRATRRLDPSPVRPRAGTRAAARYSPATVTDDSRITSSGRKVR